MSNHGSDPQSRLFLGIRTLVWAPISGTDDLASDDYRRDLFRESQAAPIPSPRSTIFGPYSDLQNCMIRLTNPLSSSTRSIHIQRSKNTASPEIWSSLLSFWATWRRMDELLECFLRNWRASLHDRWPASMEGNIGEFSSHEYGSWRCYPLQLYRWSVE